MLQQVHAVFAQTSARCEVCMHLKTYLLPVPAVARTYAHISRIQYTRDSYISLSNHGRPLKLYQQRLSLFVRGGRAALE